ncbi:hypothetical protein D3C73_900790 [compost metagenome]
MARIRVSGNTAPIPRPSNSMTGIARLTGASTSPARPISARATAASIGPRRSGKRAMNRDTSTPANTSAPVMPLSRKPAVVRACPMST